MRSSSLSASLAAILLSACAAGPTYVAPPLPGSVGAFADQGGSYSNGEDLPARWWRLYQDPVLDLLIEQALTANTDVRVAVARVERARAVVGEAGAELVPEPRLNASAQQQRAAQLQLLPGFDRENAVIDVGIGIAYEADLFGRLRRRVEAVKGDEKAAEADLDAIKVMVVAETTRAYVDVGSAARQLAVANHVLELLDRSVRATSRRSEAGMAMPLDVARITTLREQRMAEVPMLAAERQAALYRLALLTGRTPGDLSKEVTEIVAPPLVRAILPTGDGAQLLSRRPDVRAAERRLAASTARVGVATADLYPRITLAGSIGSTGFGASDLFGSGPLMWAAGPTISWSFLNQRRARAQVKAAKADTQAALAQFDGRVLQALAEAETALSNYARAIDRQAALESARVQAERTVRIVRAQQRGGRVDSLSLLDAERTYADAESRVAEAEGRVASAQIDVFRALGGGWEPSSS